MAVVAKEHGIANTTLTKSNGWEFWLCRVWLPLGLLIQLSGFFWIPNTHLYKVIVTNCLLLGALLSLFNRAAWRLAFQSGLFPLILVYLIYMSVVSFLRQSEEPFGCAHWSLYIALYIFAVGMRIQLKPIEMRRLFFAAAAICATAIIYGIGYDILYRHLWSDTYRLIGYASLYNPLRSGHLFGFFCIIALWLAMTNKGQAILNWKFIAVALVCLIGVVLTGSRAPLLGVGTAGFYLIYFAAPDTLRRKSLLISSAILVGLWALFWQRLTERGLSLRPQIWSEVLKHWQLHPWLGAGYNAPLSIRLSFINDDFFDTHNIVLAVLYYGGMIGVLLFGLIHIAAFYQSFRWRKASPWTVLAGSLMIYGMITLQFDGGSIIGRPNEFWLLLWFPIALLLNIKRISSTQPQ